MTPPEAFTVAAVQGATELFPVSSLGHAVILPWLLDWKVDQQAMGFLPFLVMLHVGTAAALLAYFWRDWWLLFNGAVGWRASSETAEYRRLVVLIVVATIPAVIVGGILEHALRRIFATPVLASIFLFANGMMLILGERLRDRRSAPSPAKRLSAMTMQDAFSVGCWQCLALLPGLSRSGATMVGGLLRGIDHEASARFSFLIAFPVISAAALFEIPKFLRSSPRSDVVELAILSAVVAAIVAFLSTAFLMKYFRHHDRQALRPFAIYCMIVGLVCVIIDFTPHQV